MKLRAGDFVKWEGSESIHQIRAGDDLREYQAHAVPLTVADAFALAGFPVPEGARIFYVEPHEWRGAAWTQSVNGEGFGHIFNDGWAVRYECAKEDDPDDPTSPDLSRLPVADAFESLPVVVRDYLEGKNNEV